jgi:hypothetical protein
MTQRQVLYETISEENGGGIDVCVCLGLTCSTLPQLSSRLLISKSEVKKNDLQDVIEETTKAMIPGILFMSIVRVLDSPTSAAENTYTLINTVPRTFPITQSRKLPRVTTIQVTQVSIGWNGEVKGIHYRRREYEGGTVKTVKKGSKRERYPTSDRTCFISLGASKSLSFRQ